MLSKSASDSVEHVFDKVYTVLNANAQTVTSAFEKLLVTSTKTMEEVRFAATAVKNAATDIGTFFRGLSNGNSLNIHHTNDKE